MLSGRVTKSFNLASLPLFDIFVRIEPKFLKFWENCDVLDLICNVIYKGLSVLRVDTVDSGKCIRCFKDRCAAQESLDVEKLVCEPMLIKLVPPKAGLP